MTKQGLLQDDKMDKFELYIDETKKSMLQMENNSKTLQLSLDKAFKLADQSKKEVN